MDAAVPTSLSSALEWLGANPEYVVCAGGTDIVPLWVRGKAKPGRLLFIGGIDEMKEIRRLDSGALRVGALVTHSQIVESPLVKAGWPVLADACRSVGSWHVRNRGTIGGNICNASPAADTLPALSVLGSRVLLRTCADSREVGIEDFVTGPGKTSLREGELVTGVVIPPMPAGGCARYRKFGLRKAMEIAVASVCACVAVDEKTRSVVEARIATGSVAPRPGRVTLAERALIGGALDGERITRAGEEVARFANPISDVRASAEYRRHLSQVLTADTLSEIAESFTNGRGIR